MIIQIILSIAILVCGIVSLILLFINHAKAVDLKQYFSSDVNYMRWVAHQYAREYKEDELEKRYEEIMKERASSNWAEDFLKSKRGGDPQDLVIEDWTD